ncbi:6,7-dimethyl-8-ribityllumazine synthase [Candidatus Bandiella numerosa]|jgi:6,7-dimethyl-8-ribityllumazine synthase|uniref:6,7-dimethyl-8-ribityllumazine synthase n=1 Tax=Candidatus Bandiella numerosa TaxID=2570586 RepID=UPI00249E2F21|nr:6,7-dimethyl-8-ribityllumazine synthase [Candidatus Bandiella numerosa]WHA05279.1 6,7-dimethyl-8-ribityllumazine synthase [Candidatus Bandiella numerosa]
MTKILISISDYYKDISKLLLDSAVSTLEKNSMNYEQIIVPGAFELASSINMGLETFEYNGVIALGCVIRGETSHYDIITRECARAIQDISIYYSIPLGFGVLTVDNIDQALSRAKKYGENAANACIQMIKVKDQFMIYNDKRYSKFN